MTVFSISINRHIITIFSYFSHAINFMFYRFIIFIFASDFKYLMKYFCFLFFSIFYLNVYSQQLKTDKNLNRQIIVKDTINRLNKKASNKKINKKPKLKIQDYKIISFKNDTTFVDTTLSIKKDYKFNYLRKDNFNLIQFSNIGQTYNTLSQDFYQDNSLPLFGARARHFNYIEIEDIEYYYVPTPFTEMFFKTAFQQGQVLDAFFTVNTSKQLNFSIAYKGLRSLGNYQNILTSTGNFRFTTNYHTKNKKYNLKTHVVMQDLLNNENGGLKDDDIVNFESGNQEFIDRSVFDPNFQNAENTLVGKRFYLNQEYLITNPSDSLKSIFSVSSIISLEDKFYKFTQTNSENDFFGESFSNTINDRVTLENFNATFYANYLNNTLGKITFGINYNNFNYGYNSVVVLNDEVIPNRLKGNNIILKGLFEKEYKGFNIKSKAGLNISGSFKGHYLDVEVGFKINSDNNISISTSTNSRLPNYNQLLNQSDYINYNWNNSGNFKNINTNQFSFQLQSNKITNLFIDYTNIENYTYFGNETLDIDNTNTKSIQSNNSVNYFRAKIQKEFKLGKLALDNSIMYQKVMNGSNVLNVPEIISRNTLYYSNHFFKKALFLQTGITLSYFTEYYMNAYNPLLTEFYAQNSTKIGGFPRLDFFINAKVRQTRIYLKAEHFNSSFTGYNYYSAPNYPFRDFTVRFGIVWNFFL